MTLTNTQPVIRITEDVQASLRCPICMSLLRATASELACTTELCTGRFPIVDGVPILINDERSAFAVADFINRQSTTFRSQGRLEKILSQVIPEITANFRAQQNYERFAEMLTRGSKPSLVLVVGCGELGRGMEALSSKPSIRLVNTDVSLGRHTSIICDSHDLPFADGTFAGVIIQAVLEHVADPPRCVAELHRVMAADAIIYAETPFMQQVHGGPFDFTRYTHLGHRRLFRQFDEIDSGATAGSALALAWAYQYFLLSFVRSPRARSMVKGFSRLTAFWLRFIDRWILDSPGTLDAALGYYFLGRKSRGTLSDRELVSLYRGAGKPLPQPIARELK